MFVADGRDANKPARDNGVRAWVREEDGHDEQGRQHHTCQVGNHSSATDGVMRKLSHGRSEALEPVNGYGGVKKRLLTSSREGKGTLGTAPSR